MACVDVERHAVVAAPIMLGINAHIIQYDMRLIALMMRGIGCECVVAALSHARHQWLNRFSFFPRELQAHAQCRRIAPVPDLCLVWHALRTHPAAVGTQPATGAHDTAGKHTRTRACVGWAATALEGLGDGTLGGTLPKGGAWTGRQRSHWRVWRMAP
eukprot:1146522-Pelagomonas_calceolata.AAC.1